MCPPHPRPRCSASGYHGVQTVPAPAWGLAEFTMYQFTIHCGSAIGRPKLKLICQSSARGTWQLCSINKHLPSPSVLALGRPLERTDMAMARDSVWGGGRHRDDDSGSNEWEARVGGPDSAWGLWQWLLHRPPCPFVRARGYRGCGGVRKTGTADQGVSIGKLRPDTASQNKPRGIHNVPRETHARVSYK